MTPPMLVIPKDTLLYEPDDIHRVTLQFPTQDDAIIFFEWLRSVLDAAPYGGALRTI